MADMPQVAVKPDPQTYSFGDDVAQEVIVRGLPISNPSSHVKTDPHSSSANMDTLDTHCCVSAKSKAPSRGARPGQQKLSTTCIDHRMHYRIIMDVVGIPMHQVADLSKAFRALADVVKACEMMCRAGYNHRDLSPGNIIVGTDGRGRLGDLKFSTRFMSEEAGHVEGTGTPDFMAIEVLLQMYLFSSERRPPKARSVTAPFRQNAGHDLESIWWIAVFLLYNTVTGVNITYEMAKEQRKKMNRLFLLSNRAIKFKVSLTTDIYQDFDGSPVQPAVNDILDPMLNSLHDAYAAFEQQGDMTNNGDFLDLHQEFHEKLVAMSKYFEGLSGKTLAEVSKPLSAPAHHPMKLENAGSEQDARDQEGSTKVEAKVEDEPDGRGRGKRKAVAEEEEPRRGKPGKRKGDAQAAAESKESTVAAYRSKLRSRARKA